MVSLMSCYCVNFVYIPFAYTPVVPTILYELNRNVNPVTIYKVGAISATVQMRLSMNSGYMLITPNSFHR